MVSLTKRKIGWSILLLLGVLALASFVWVQMLSANTNDGTISNFTVTSGDKSFTLNWDRPDAFPTCNRNGRQCGDPRDVRGYHIEYRALYPDTGWIRLHNMDKMYDSSVTLNLNREWTTITHPERGRRTEIYNGMAHQFRIRAYNTSSVSKGRGPWAKSEIVTSHGDVRVLAPMDNFHGALVPPPIYGSNHGKVWQVKALQVKYYKEIELHTSSSGWEGFSFLTQGGSHGQGCYSPNCPSFSLNGDNFSISHIAVNEDRDVSIRILDSSGDPADLNIDHGITLYIANLPLRFEDAEKNGSTYTWSEQPIIIGSWATNMDVALTAETVIIKVSNNEINEGQTKRESVEIYKTYSNVSPRNYDSGVIVRFKGNASYGQDYMTNVELGNHKCAPNKTLFFHLPPDVKAITPFSIAAIDDGAYDPNERIRIKATVFQTNADGCSPAGNSRSKNAIINIVENDQQGDAQPTPVYTETPLWQREWDTNNDGLIDNIEYARFIAFLRQGNNAERGVSAEEIAAVNAAHQRWLDLQPAPTAVPPTPTPTPVPPPQETPPGPVAYVGIYGSGTDRNAIIVWPEPTTGGTAQVYEVCINKYDADASAKRCAIATDRTHTFSNLDLTTYVVTVTPRNSHGDGPTSQESITLSVSE